MILLNKFIQCLNGLWTLNDIRLNSSYISGCLANSIILKRVRQNIVFSYFGTIDYGSCQYMNFNYRVSKILIFQRNNCTKQLEFYKNVMEKIVCRIDDYYRFVDTNISIKDILNALYGY